ncbi:MAG: hydantoinase B/oxoprolinase family protein [Rhodobiaceae bacterium]|nr:hydantoinase B/oxoprolinase family protein [Rhodobiaceae bacterium]
MDAVRTEVMKNRFAAIVEEAATIIYRTAHTTFVKQTQDYQCALAGLDGYFFAFPVLNGVTSSAGLNVRKPIDAIGIENLEPGDIIITNDPFESDGMCTHTMDVHLLKPIFFQDRLICFGWSFLHASDIGGAVPGSISPTSTDVFQEGIRMRATKLYRAGVLNTELMDLFKDNCRIPEQVWGDFKAMVAALTTMDRRITSLCERYGLSEFEAGAESVLAYADRKAREVFGAIPDGQYRFGDYLEGVVADQLAYIQATMTVAGDTIDLDFTGSSPQAASAINFVTAEYGHPFLCRALMNYIVTMVPEAPLNAGLLRNVTARAPRGTVMNCTFPAAMGNRAVTISRIYDTVLGCLNQALPDGLAASGASQAGIIMASARDHRTGLPKVSVVQPLIGGSGGRRVGDGVDGVDTPIGFLRSAPVEAVETEAPIVLRRYELMPDSCGAGRFRSGAAIVIDIESRDPNLILTVRGLDRFRFAPWGVRGGAPGRVGQTLLNPGRNTEEFLGQIKVQEVMVGDVVRLVTPAGGGFGDPFNRDPERVASDVRGGLLSVGNAASQYGVAVTDGRVDEAATNALRNTGARETAGTDFAFNASRLAYEAVWPPAVQAYLCERILAAPAGLRTQLMAAIRRQYSDRKEELGPADIDAAIDRAMAGFTGRSGSLPR